MSTEDQIYILKNKNKKNAPEKKVVSIERSRRLKKKKKIKQNGKRKNEEKYIQEPEPYNKE